MINPKERMMSKIKMVQWVQYIHCDLYIASDGEGHPDLYRYGSFANSDGVPDTRLLPNKQLTGPVGNIRNIIEVHTTWN